MDSHSKEGDISTISISTDKQGVAALPLYVTLGLVKHMTRCRSISSEETNLEHTGHLKPGWTEEEGGEKKEGVRCKKRILKNRFVCACGCVCEHLEGQVLYTPGAFGTHRNISCQFYLASNHGPRQYQMMIRPRGHTHRLQLHCWLP